MEEDGEIYSPPSFFFFFFVEKWKGAGSWREDELGLHFVKSWIIISCIG